jgi:hypothetical protein
MRECRISAAGVDVGRPSLCKDTATLVVTTRKGR